jgi:hypothetical protein
MLPTSLALAAALLAAAHAVDVRSSTPCPSSEDVTERLRPLLPEIPTDDLPPDLATVDVADAATLRLRLVRPNGSELGDRRVMVQGDCAETAATVAAVIAAWETEPPPPPATVAVAAPRAPARPAASPWRVLAGAGGGVAMVGGAAAVGKLEVVAGKALSRLQARVGFAAETARTLELSTGSVAWAHTTFEATVAIRTLAPIWSLSLDAGPALGWATLTGRNFSQNRTQHSFEYGAVAGLRLARGLGRWSVWVEGRAYGWARGQRASLAGETSHADLPWVDATASVGLSAPLFW